MSKILTKWSNCLHCVCVCFLCCWQAPGPSLSQEIWHEKTTAKFFVFAFWNQMEKPAGEYFKSFIQLFCFSVFVISLFLYLRYISNLKLKNRIGKMQYLWMCPRWQHHLCIHDFYKLNTKFCSGPYMTFLIAIIRTSKSAFKAVRQRYGIWWISLKHLKGVLIVLKHQHVYRFWKAADMLKFRVTS